MLKEVSQKIIDLFKADASLSEPGKVRRWFFGPPAEPYAYPYGYVKVRGGPLAALSIGGSPREQLDAEWDCVVIDSQPAEDVAEKSVMDKTEAMRGVLKSNRTLDGLALDSQVTRWVFEVAETEQGPHLYGGLLVLRVRKVLT